MCSCSFIFLANLIDFLFFIPETFDKLEQAPLPEIQRTNIAQVLLQLKVLGVQSPAHFPFLSPPTEISMRKAFELLLRLKALDEVRKTFFVSFVVFRLLRSMLLCIS